MESIDYCFRKLKLLASHAKLPHAVLLEGGNDVFIAAKNFVAWYLCEEPEYCNYSCTTCKMWQAGTHPDCLLIVNNANQEIKIDIIREINSFATNSSYYSTKKIILINNFNKINEHAANALLKNLEEPLDNILFLLISNNIAVLPTTLLSRVLQVRLNINTLPDYPTILEDLYNIWVNKQQTSEIINKWLKINKQQLIFSLWSVVTNAVKLPINPKLLQIRKKITINILWQLIDSLNYINKAIILNEPVNWQLYLENFIFTPLIEENRYYYG